MPPEPPVDVQQRAQARSAARIRRDFAEADRLRGEIEAAGWTVVDFGTAFELRPSHPLTIVEDGRTRYGASGEVPSRLDEAPVGFATVVIVATDWPQDLERALRGLVEHGPDGLQVVVVADGASAEQEAALDELEAVEPGEPGIRTEVVRTSERLGWAAALNAGIRRAEAATVVLLDTSVELTGDAIGPLVAELDDPTVALTGPFGVRSANLRQFEEAGPADVTAIEGYLMAFRRADYAARGPLDEKFRFYRNLDIWWSLVLRDEGEGRDPRRAVALELPVVRHEHRGWESLDEIERNRLSRRNFYRIIDRFGHRRDLATGA